MKENILKTSPSALGLLLRAGLKRTQSPLPSDLSLPDTRLTLKAQSIPAKQLQRFHRVTDWQDKAGSIHPSFPHIIAFPLHMKLMLDNGFPFSPVGLVHINQHITQYRAINQQDLLSIHCQFDSLKQNDKGWAFSILTQVYCADDKVWSGRSDILYRSGKKANRKPEDKQRAIEPQNTNTWNLDKGLGRRYALSSNDYNPIHLFGWTAKLLGFKRPIAHGMWSISRSISQLQAKLSYPFNCQCQFVKPVFLPAQVKIGWQDEGNETLFSVSSDGNEQPLLHLTGSLRADLPD